MPDETYYPVVGEKAYSRRSMTYGELDLDRGQVFTIRDYPGNEKLGRLGYIAKLQKKTVTHTCSDCGNEFLDISARDYHGRTAHPRRAMSLMDEERLLDEKERRENEINPLYLEKTLASQK